MVYTEKNIYMESESQEIYIRPKIKTSCNCSD